MIQAEGVTFRYVGRKRPTLRNVSFSVERGETLLVLGPSGCGKSTLALCLNGAIPHFIEGDFSGSLRIGGQETRATSMATLAQRVGIVFQDPEAQFCMLTVEDEVAFGLENLAVPRAEMDARIDEALDIVGLTDRRRDRIERLSGGQKQRLALASVLAQRPEVLVFDEPTAQLDPVGAAEVVALLGQLRATGRYTLIVVEHRLDELMHLIDRVLLLGPTGEMIAHDAPRTVMRDHGAWLASTGIWVPQVTELALELERTGVHLPTMPLTVAEAAAELQPLVPRLRASLPVNGAAPVSAHPPTLEVRHLSHQFATAPRPTLRDVSFALSPGEFVAVAGANGAGKSTLARHLVRLLDPPPGTVFLQHDDLRAIPPALVAQRIGYVFQYPEHQFVGASVLDDVAYGLRHSIPPGHHRPLPEADAISRAQAMLDDFGLGHLGPAHPFSLSHGEQRRLSVASMLVLGQRVLLLDEPTFGQDRRNATMLLDKLAALAAAGKTIVAITHDMRLVAERSQRVLVLSEGELIFDGSAATLFADASLPRKARLIPPPLWELSQRLGLPTPLVRVDDFVSRCAGDPVAARPGGGG